MSLQSSSIFDPKLLPNLPGFRPKPLNTGFKKSYFKIVDGNSFLKDEYIPPPGTLEGDEGSVATFAPNSTVSKARKQLALQNANIILKFNAYFEEYVDGSNRAQVRQCNIFFFVEDGTLKIVEKPQVNSGVSQGTLVRRAIINKADGTPYVEEDFHVGDWLTIYGRTFRITGCDKATRDYLIEHFSYSPSSFEEIKAPADPYLEYRKTVEAGQADTWGKFHAKKNENKTFNEALLGHSVDNKGREGFLRYGSQTLKFRCTWDDTSHLYGDVNEFTLTYYLADDSLEIVSIPSMITKEQTRLKLLKRSRLPKNFHQGMGLGTRLTDDSYFHWADFYIGLELEVFGRVLTISDADPSTREFYYSQNLAFGPPITRPPPEVSVHEREIPPPTGFGSEEDSLRSVAGSLLPGPAPVKKLGENKVLSFFCSLLSGGIDDVERRFVITYYVTDSTMKIVEPPVRNSGFTGGVFLSRRTIKHPNGDTIKEHDLYVGRRLKVLKHEFLLLDTNETTLHWMEDKGFPRSNFYAILDKMRPVLIEAATSGQLYQECQQCERPEYGTEQITKDDLRRVLVKYNLCSESYTDNKGTEDYVSEHELRTILRANGNKKETFNYRKLIEQIVNPTDEFK